MPNLQIPCGPAITGRPRQGVLDELVGGFSGLLIDQTDLYGGRSDVDSQNEFGSSGLLAAASLSDQLARRRRCWRRSHSEVEWKASLLNFDFLTEKQNFCLCFIRTEFHDTRITDCQIHNLILKIRFWKCPLRRK